MGVAQHEFEGIVFAGGREQRISGSQEEQTSHLDLGPSLGLAKMNPEKWPLPENIGPYRLLISFVNLALGMGCRTHISIGILIKGSSYKISG